VPSQVRGIVAPHGISYKARPTPLPHGTQRPTGSRRYHTNVAPIYRSGPGLPPVGFLNGNNSVDEWFIWWALSKELGPPGQGNWLYQTRIAPQLPGGIKPDFLVLQNPPLVIRVQSDRYHLMQSSWVIGYDREQRIQLEHMGYLVVDVFPQQYVHDLSGVSAIIIVREALQGRQRIDPIVAQTSTARA
jgi:hypothetical protein